MHEEYRQRLASEYRFAVTKMQEAKDLTRKLFYFSVLFGDAQRILNWEWNRELVTVYVVAQHVHTQINTALQLPTGQILPINWADIFEKLTQIAIDLTAYFEKVENVDNKNELYDIIERFAEISYVVSGNGSYLHEKGMIKL